MRFKDKRQHKKRELDDLEVSFSSDKYGNQIIAMKSGELSVSSFYSDYNCEKTKKLLKRRLLTMVNEAS